MSGQVPNSQNIYRVGSGVADGGTVAVHPEYYYWWTEWLKIRDVLAGQREVKRKQRIYLAGTKKMDAADYEMYLARATFYNMTKQTVTGMLGQVFMRDPLIMGMPDRFKNAIRLKFGKDGSGHINFAKTVMYEQIALGRYGVLVDAPDEATLTPSSFAVGYAAENILDWDVEQVNGEYVPTRVLLREFRRQKNTPKPETKTAKVRRVTPTAQPSPAFVESYTYATVYRELLLETQEDGTTIYVQNLYFDSPNGAPNRSVPLLRGAPLTFIPFKFFGAQYNNADVEQSPILDIVDLNLSHYRTYAELEWGRMYTALPVYYAPVGEEGAGEYDIGPSVVWEIQSQDMVPGILEYKGQGLSSLEKALSTKEQQIAAIGGRMVPGVTSKGSASAEETARSSQAEQALLLHCIQACEVGMTDCIRWYLMWRDVPLDQSEDLDYSMNRIFGDAGIDARALRVFQQLHDEGKLPIEVIYNVVIESGFLDPETTLDQFIEALNDPENFPNNPDVLSRQRGFSSRAQELDQQNQNREMDQADEEIDLQTREVVLMEKAPPPLPPAPPQAGGAALPARPSGPVAAKPGKVKGKKTK